MSEVRHHSSAFPQGAPACSPSGHPPARPGHTPVLLVEGLAWLRPAPGSRVVDATVGLGGHAAAIVERLGPAGRLIGVDRDPRALEIAAARLTRRCEQLGWSAPFPWSLHRARFDCLPRLLRETAQLPVDGMLFDLGVSSLQLDLAERGFSFQREGPLDMRMDPESKITAADLVNTLPQEELARILWEYGEERHSRRIARRIVERRPVRTTRELSDLVAGVYAAAGGRRATHLGRPLGSVPGPRRHPATRTFQALRIAVNDELLALDVALQAAPDLLSPEGRLVVIAYHSLEDRIVKRALEFLSGKCRCPPELPACACGARPLLRILTRKPVTPSPAEVEANPRARSARLRAAQRL